jgi:hypothetical protein
MSKQVQKLEIGDGVFGDDNDGVEEVLAAKTWAMTARDEANKAHRLALSSGTDAGAWKTVDMWLRQADRAASSWAKENEAAEAAKSAKAWAATHVKNVAAMPKVPNQKEATLLVVASERDHAQHDQASAAAALEEVSKWLADAVRDWIAMPAHCGAKMNAEKATAAFRACVAALGRAKEKLEEKNAACTTASMACSADMFVM